MTDIQQEVPPASAKLPKRRLPPLLRKAWYGLNQAFRRRIAHLEITPDQFTVLRNLHEARRGGLTQRELTARMASDPNTIASLVERMERARLLERRTDPRDRRARRLRLVVQGRRRFEAASAVAAALQEEVLGGVLPPSEREVFLELLERVAAACAGAAERETSAGRASRGRRPRRGAEAPGGEGADPLGG